MPRVERGFKSSPGRGVFVGAPALPKPVRGSFGPLLQSLEDGIAVPRGLPPSPRLPPPPATSVGAAMAARRLWRTSRRDESAPTESSADKTAGTGVSRGTHKTAPGTDALPKAVSRFPLRRGYGGQAACHRTPRRWRAHRARSAIPPGLGARVGQSWNNTSAARSAGYRFSTAGSPAPGRKGTCLARHRRQD